MVEGEGLGLSSSSGAAKNDLRLCARIAHVTDVGRRRRNNQDAHLVFPLQSGDGPASAEAEVVVLGERRLLLAVADGMGGHFGGELASRLCVENLAKEIVNQFEPSAIAPPNLPACLQKAVEATHKAVFAQAQEYAESRTMGTTLTAGLLYGTRAEVAQVGDSRAYLLRAGNLVLLTKDQTIGNQLRSRGEDPSSVDVAIQDMLTQAIGAQAEIEVAMTGVDLEPEDVLLLCSDGLYKVVPPAEIVAILERGVGLPDKAAQLVGLANEGGGPDNITVVLTHISQVEGAG